VSIGLPGTGPGFARSAAAPPHAPDHGRWRILAILSLAELLAMSTWFAANAVAPQLALRWHLTAARASWFTAAVQLGFVAGTATAAILNLADLIPLRRYFATTATLSALANAALAIAPDPVTALLSRFLVGFFLAGVYPPGMKMVATWFRSHRGLAIGTMVGSLGIGSAMPYLVHAMRGAGVEQVVLSVSAAALLAALLVALAYHDGPYPFARRPFAWSLVATVLHHRDTRLAIGGYLGHMWELYAMWIWLGAFLTASLAARVAAGSAPLPAHAVDLVVAGTFLAGALGCVWGGWAAGRIGYARVVTRAMVISGACSATIGFFFGTPPWLLVPIIWLWGFFIVADSAQFSAMVTEAAPPHAVGTALTLQTSIGFLLTMATIQLVPVLVNAIGWRWAFSVLALGPACGIAAIAGLDRAHGAVTRT